MASRLPGGPRRARVRWLLSAALVALACGEPPPANVVLISVDTLRADRLGAWGHADARTPVLDRLAREGVRFAAAETSFPRTTPALASLLTGLYPKNHGSREVGRPIAAGRTLAERLGERGWQTVAVVSNRAVDRSQRLDRGFDRFEVTRHDPVTEEALGRTRDLAPDRPLFLWAHYIEPHFPYAPEPGTVDEGSIARCREITTEVGARRISRGALRANRGGVAERALADCWRAYDAEVAETDRQIGALLDGLRAQGRLERAFVVFTADHGENFGEGRLWYEHGSSVHQAALHVPLIITGPGIRPGVREELARLEDVAPTLLSLVGIEPVEGEVVDGADLSPLLRPSLLRCGPAAGGLESRIAFAEGGSALQVSEFERPLSGRAGHQHCWNEPPFSLCASAGEAPRLYDHVADPDLTTDISAREPAVVQRLIEASRRWPPETLRERSAREGRFKLVETPRLDGSVVRELYDLAADPAERTDVSARHPEVARRLAAALAEWSAPVPAPADQDEGTVDALRALGYVE
jgi:arylsulfatase